MEKRVHKLTFYHPRVERVAQCFESEVYLVGGFIRDRLLRVKKDYIDVDFVVKKVEEKELKCLEEVFKRKGFRIKKTKEVFSFVFGNSRFDFSTMEGKTIEEDLKKRDFTINALAVNLTELTLPFNDDVVLIDPTGGYEDLIRGVVRPVSKTSLEDDPLRVLRGIRFKNILDFEYSEEFLELAPQFSPKLEEIPEERVKEELLKLLKADKFAPALREMVQLKAFFPVFKELKGIERIPPGGLHQFDLLEHTLRTVEFMENFALPEAPTYLKEFSKEVLRDKEALKLVALYHDVGKPLTAKERNGRLTFYGHDKVGAPVGRDALIRLGFGKEWGKIAYYVIRNHLRPFFLFDLFRKKKLTDRAIYRFFKDCRGYGFHTLSVSVADFMATSEEMAENVNEYLNFILYLVSFYRERLKDLKPLLSGEEIMEIKGFERPNEWIGKIKEKMLELQAVGKIRTKEEAISFVKGFTVKEEG